MAKPATMPYRLLHGRHPNVADRSQAFKLVRRVLSDKPRSFQDIIVTGLKLYSQDQPSKGVDEALALSENLPKKSREIRPQRIPLEHPFRSAKYLKTRILAVLESQELIHKEAIRAVPGTVKGATTSRALDGDSCFRWFLTPPKPHRAVDPMGKWSVPEHWDRLCQPGQNTASIYYDLKNTKRLQAIVERERRIKAGKEKIPERESWIRPDRIPGVTTRLQRMHLSRRKQKSRTAKELKLVAARDEYDAMKRRARQEAEAAFREANKKPKTLEEPVSEAKPAKPLEA